MQYMSHGGHIYGQRGGAIFYVDTSWGPPGIKKGKAVIGDWIKGEFNDFKTMKGCHSLKGLGPYKVYNSFQKSYTQSAIHKHMESKIDDVGFDDN